MMVVMVMVTMVAVWVQLSTTTQASTSLRVDL
jgi:hypothetical protein